MTPSNRARRLVFVLAALVLLAIGVVPSASADASHSRTTATLRDATGQRVGTVRLIEADGSTVVVANVSSLAPGFHGFHIHQTGLCEAPFTTAGGHFNPDGATHRDHVGDMPSLLVSQDGTASLAFETDRFTPGDLFDADGSAVIIHAASDNYANVPDRYHSHEEDVFGPDSATLATGDAGSRTACGVVVAR